jgi:hypothetical protein
VVKHRHRFPISLLDRSPHHHQAAVETDRFRAALAAAAAAAEDARRGAAAERDASRAAAAAAAAERERDEREWDRERGGLLATLAESRTRAWAMEVGDREDCCGQLSPTCLSPVQSVLVGHE